MSQLDQPGEPEHQLSRPEDFVGNMALVGEKAAMNTQAFLQRHADLIPAETIAKIVARERDSVVKAFSDKRKEGRANDNACDQPGLKIYFTQVGKDLVTEVCAGAGYPEFSWQEVGDGVWLVELPGAVYSAGFGGIQFHMHSTATGPRKLATNPFSSAYNMVIRIEGISGALWQNANYNWELSQKTAR